MDQKAVALGKQCDMKWSYCTCGGGQCGLSGWGGLLAIWLVVLLAKCLLLYLAPEKPPIKSAEFSMRSYCGGCCITFYCLTWRPQTDVRRSTVWPSSFLPPKKKNPTQIKQKRVLNATSPGLKPFANHLWDTQTVYVTDGSPEPDSKPCFP